MIEKIQRDLGKYTNIHLTLYEKVNELVDFCNTLTLQGEESICIYEKVNPKSTLDGLRRMPKSECKKHIEKPEHSQIETYNQYGQME